MKEKIHPTERGNIHYWISDTGSGTGPELVFLPGLTADHRLFKKQIEYFNGEYRMFVWDAPGHRASFPFDLSFSLEDKARWLDEILEAEGFHKPVIIGQSMGGYVGQVYARLFPEKLYGYISIDSAPLEKAYYRAWELWILRRMEPVYFYYPWRMLLKDGSEGAAASVYGRSLMRCMMMAYDGDKRRYAKLAGHGFRILAEEVDADHSYEFHCPALLICGEKDQAGFCVRYNKAWHKRTGIPISWIRGAGHNSNTDQPDLINRLIGEFLLQLKE